MNAEDFIKQMEAFAEKTKAGDTEDVPPGLCDDETRRNAQVIIRGVDDTLRHDQIYDLGDIEQHINDLKRAVIMTDDQADIAKAEELIDHLRSISGK